MDVLERLLFDLRSSIEQNDSVLTPTIIVENIAAHAFGEEMGDVDQEYVSHLLLQSESPPSLLIFLRDSPHSKNDAEITKAKVATLKFLAKYVKHTESIEQFALLAFVTFCNSFVQEESNVVKAACLLPLNRMLRRCGLLQESCNNTGNTIHDLNDLGRILLSHKINMTMIFEMFLKELRTNAKISKGMKCELLKLLGLMIGAYYNYEFVKSRITTVVDLCLYELKKNFSSNCRDSELSTIAGCFSCLDRCLFLPEIKQRLENNSNIWEYLLKAISAVSTNDLTRYAAASKALRLIKHHSKLFQILIGKNSVQTYKAIEQCHETGKKSIIKHSEEALFTVLTQIATAAINEKNETKETKTMIQNLFNRFLKILTTSNIVQKNVIIAVKGISAISLSINLIDLSDTRKFLDFSIVKKQTVEDENNFLSVGGEIISERESVVLSIIFSLIKSAAGFHIEEDSRDDENRISINEDNDNANINITSLSIDAILNTSLYLYAIASIIFASIEFLKIPNELISYLIKSSVDVIIGYPRLQSQQQLIAKKALSLILHSLSYRESIIVRQNDENNYFDGKTNNNNCYDKKPGNKNNCNNDSNYYDNDRDNDNNKNNNNNKNNKNDNYHHRNNNHNNENSNDSNIDNSNRSDGSGSKKIDRMTNNTSNKLLSSISLLSQYLDQIIPALLLRSMSRSLPNENIVVDKALFQVLNEQLRSEKLEGVSHSSTDKATSTLGDRMVPAYFTLWRELITPTDPEIKEKIFLSNEMNKSNLVMKKECLKGNENRNRNEIEVENDYIDNKNSINNNSNDNNYDNKNNNDNNNVSDRRNVKVAIYDRLMLEILNYLRKLDLSYLSGDSINQRLKKNSRENSNKIKPKLTSNSRLNPIGEEQSQFQILENFDENEDEEMEEEEDNNGEDGDGDIDKDASNDVLFPNNLADQDILISLVIFLELFLPYNVVHRLIAWFPLLCDECIELSKCYPSVSALYRIILCLTSSVILPPYDNLFLLLEADEGDERNATSSIHHHLSHRHPNHLNQSFPQDTQGLNPSTTSTSTSFSSSIISKENSKQIKNTVLNIRLFITNLQTSKINHFHDELLSTSLLMILCIPSYFIPFNVLLSSITLALQSGVQVLYGVTALQKIVDTYYTINDSHNIDEKKESSLLKESFEVILPLLDSYLLIGYKEKNEVGQIQLEPKEKKASIQIQQARNLFRISSDTDDCDISTNNNNNDNNNRKKNDDNCNDSHNHNGNNKSTSNDSTNINNSDNDNNKINK